MLYLRVAAAILAAVVFGGKFEEMVNKYLKPSDDFMTKLSHYGAPVAVGVGAFATLGFFLGKA